MAASTNVPQFMTGDFVEFKKYPEFKGMIVSVQHSNYDVRFNDIYPYVFYVLSLNPAQRVDGPYFASQIHHVRSH